MIKCCECGKEVNRIQWTHLRNKCIGNVKTVKEYMDKYPEALIVDRSISKKTAVTLENMIAKYGDIEGKKRWDIYRELQSKSNTYEYKKEKYGWSKEKFDEYNASRAITLYKCIERHGEREGLIKWQNYCDKQAYTNTKKYFIEKYGLELGTQKYIEYNIQKGNSSSPEFYAEKMNISLDEATKLIIAKFNRSSLFGSNLEKEFTLMLEKKIGKLDHTTFSKPYGKWSYLLNSYVIYDIKHGDYVIEFNGDYWHANPILYESSAIIKGGRTANEIWEKDRMKIQTVLDIGLKVMVVWESEFLNDKNGTIERVTKWMQSGQE